MTEHKTKHHPFHGFVPNEAAEHARAAHSEMRKSVQALFPPEFVEHRRRARKEMLLAVQSVVNAALERFEEQEA